MINTFLGNPKVFFIIIFFFWEKKQRTLINGKKFTREYKWKREEVSQTTTTKP